MVVSCGGGGGEAVDLHRLPEGCIANAVSLTSPVDACRIASVSWLFRSAADADVVWERFLPSDYMDIVSRAVDLTPLYSCSTKKELFLRLCDDPLIIDGGAKSFSLDKRSGKKCYMLGARDLFIVWGDTPWYWRWSPSPESRFPEVAELISVCWLEICGKINISMLSPATKYAAYFVFKSTVGAYGFEYQPVEVTVGLVGHESKKGTAFLAELRRRRPRRSKGGPCHARILGSQVGMRNENECQCMSGESEGRYPKQRGDGWLEIELGEFFNKGGENREVEMSVSEINGGEWKGGLIVYGIEIRPKEGK